MTSVSAFSAEKAIYNSGTLADEFLKNRKKNGPLAARIGLAHPGAEAFVRFNLDVQLSPKSSIDAFLSHFLSGDEMCSRIVGRALLQKPQLPTEQSRDIIIASKKYYVARLVKGKADDLSIDSVKLPTLERSIGKKAAEVFMRVNQTLCDNAPKDAIDLGTEYLTKCGCFTNKEEARSTLETTLFSDPEPDLNVYEEFVSLPKPRACATLKEACEE